MRLRRRQPQLHGTVDIRRIGQRLLCDFGACRRIIDIDTSGAAIDELSINIVLIVGFHVKRT